MKHGLASFITGDQETVSLDLSGGESDSVSPSKCGDGSIDNAMESDLATRGATLTQHELNAQGGNSVVAILTKILDEPDMELRTEVAEGLCKLLMIGAISSPKLLSRLLLIWYNPMTESDSKLRHILGTFFPLYCSMSKFHQKAMEDAFVPTMKILFDAPVTSPLAEIDIEDVGMFFVHLTREDMLQSFDKDKATANILESSSTSVHDSLAISVCNQVLSAPDGYQTKVLVKILTNLVLTHNNFVHLRELKVLSESLIGSIKEKSVIRSVEKFDKQLRDWLAKDPSISRGEDAPAAKNTDEDDGDENATTDGSLTPTRSRKRILFSQTLSNTLLDPDQLPLKAPRTSSSSSYRSPTNKQLPSTDDTTDDDEEDHKDTTLVDNNPGEIQKVPDTDSEEDTVTEGKETEKTPPKEGRGKLVRADEKTRSKKGECESSSQTVSIDILPVTSEEEPEDDSDIFSDASSINSANVSKLPKGSVVDNSTDSDSPEEEQETPKAEAPAPRGRGRSKIPTLDLTTSSQSRSSRSSAASSPATSVSKRSSRSSRYDFIVNIHNRYFCYSRFQPLYGSC